MDQAERRINEHPGYVAYSAYRGFARTLHDVWRPNWNWLAELLCAGATNSDLAFEMMRPPPASAAESTIRQQFEGELARFLHNYLASTMTLVDHSRVLVGQRTAPPSDSFAELWADKLADVTADPVVPFFQDLRNFTLHYKLSVSAHRFSATNMSAGQELSSEVELSCRDLRRWSKWTARSRQYMEGKLTIPLREAVDQHGKLILDANQWLLSQLQEENADAMFEVNELISERNQIMATIGAPPRTTRLSS